MTEDVCCCAASAADATFRESRPGFTSASSSATPDSTSSTLKFLKYPINHKVYNQPMNSILIKYTEGSALLSEISEEWPTVRNPPRAIVSPAGGGGGSSSSGGGGGGWRRSQVIPRGGGDGLVRVHWG